jgi:hypothetical protein
MISIYYRLTGTGWSECTINDGNNSVLITASYLSDALGNLLSAVLKLIHGEKKVKTSFDEEPGEYRWVFEISSTNMVNLTLLQFDELWGNKPDRNGKKIFQTECTLEDLVLAIFEASDRVLEEYGEKGYLKKWIEYKFPIEQYNTINNWLKAR